MSQTQRPRRADAPSLREVLGPGRPPLGERTARPHRRPERRASDVQARRAAPVPPPADDRIEPLDAPKADAPSQQSRVAAFGEMSNGTEPAAPEAATESRHPAEISALSRLTGGFPTAPLVVLFAMALLHGLEVRAFAELVPHMQDFYGVNVGAVLGMATVGTLVAALLLAPAGYLGDRLPRTRIAAFIAGARGLLSLATAFAPIAPLLGAVRTVAGMSGGNAAVMGPAGQVTGVPGAAVGVEAINMSILADAYPREQRAKVFSIYFAAYGVAAVAGGFIAGTLARVLFWQAPFLLYALASAGVVYLLVRLKEPVRGGHERIEQGADEEMAHREDPAPSWGESWRMSTASRTMRRWLLASVVLASPVFALWMVKHNVYVETWDLTATPVTWLLTLDGYVELAGFIVAGLLGHKLLQQRPGRILAYLAVAGVLSAGLVALLAVAPVMPLAVVAGTLLSFVGAFLRVWPFVLVAMLAPPRARGYALGIAAAVLFAGGFAWMFAIPFGEISTTFLLLLAGAQIAGAFILASGVAFAEDDIRNSASSSMASALSRQARKEGQTNLLVCRNVDVHYDDVQILFGVDFEVQEGEIIALLGTNGAGKSTLLRAISGLTPPTSGSIVFDFEEVTHMPPHERAARGVTFMPGGRSNFPSLTVGENLKLAAWVYRSDEAYVEAATKQVLEFFPILDKRFNELAGNLSGGEQQMLALGQAFLSRPRLLMIDELSLGLAPAVVEQLLHIVRAIHEQGTTIIVVEQSVNVALTVAERAVFMEKGEVRFSGPTSELMQRGDILRAIFLQGAGAAGGSIGSMKRQRNPFAEEREVALEVSGIVKRFGGVNALNDVSFTLEDGKIIGLIGPNGAGKTTLFDVISGFVPADQGRVRLYEHDMTELPPDERSKLGLQRSFQDARLFPALTVYENLAVSLERHMESRSATMAALRLPNVRRSEQRLARRVERLIDLLNLGDFRDKFVKELSTGSRRMVDLACIMAADPKVVLLDEPSSGIAQAEAEELGPLLQRVKYETGCSMLVIEHDMPLIKSVSDELIALDLGAVVTRGLPDEVTEHPRVVESYLGTNEQVVMRSGQVKAT